MERKKEKKEEIERSQMIQGLRKLSEWVMVRSLGKLFEKSRDVFVEIKDARGLMILLFIAIGCAIIDIDGQWKEQFTGNGKIS